MFSSPSRAALSLLLLAPASLAIITHQGHAASDEDALSQWLELQVPENETLAARDLMHGMSTWDPTSLLSKRQREENGDGALLCEDGECVDHSCCGPDGICGYGPDFCGEGCQSNCDATAMCGKFSEGGDIACGLDLCCSWGGWCGTADVHCIGPNEWALCQEGYGKCEIVRPEKCGSGSGTASGRMIGYYQASNVRDRACNKISPSQIKTTGYTHLYFAFASIDPGTYKITPWDDGDADLMREFTKLRGQGRNLQTWIAVGGWAFSEPDAATATTWADICADQSKRAIFIQSLIDFMVDYGFQGVDLDWEYPGTPERGGSRADIANFVTLVREMREAFGTKYGISLTLAPDYWYLRYFDVAGLDPYVDHMGFMAYDLHGFWDADVDALGSIVRGQANINEIANNTLPLAYAGVDPAKIDIGIAWYGRGYTLSDPSCNTLGCPFSGPSRPGRCTNSAGVLSLVEIQQMIEAGEAKSNMLPEIGMKELVWDDQWIGYDDDETAALKRAFANDNCFGGLMAWSVDFNSGEGDSNDAPVSTNGRCGPDNGGATCPDSGFGDCCSSTGWCGSTDGHCGAACISGKCQTGGETTTGRCGAGFHDFTCGDWPQGSCCSSGGYCGNSTVHCGDGCQSGCDGSDGGDGGDDENEGDGTDAPEFTPNPDAGDELEPCFYSPTTLDQINNLDFRNELPTHCVAEYMTPVLHNMLQKALDRYHEILDDGYDGYFDTYAEYLVSESNSVVYTFLKEHGKEYFDCEVTKQVWCCTNCQHMLEANCNDCLEECNIESPYDDGSEFVQLSKTCPPDTSGGNDWKQSIRWKLKEDKEDEWWGAITAETGAPKDDFIWSEYGRIPNTHLSASCAREYAYDGVEGMSEPCYYEGYWFDKPGVGDGFEEGDVVNPKDVVEQSLKNSTILMEPLATDSFEILEGVYEDSARDLIDAVLLPVLMIQESLTFMENVVEMAKEIEEAEKKTLILNLLSGFLFLLGGAGSTLASAGMQTIGRIAVYLSELGGTGMGIYGIVTDPQSAPMSIFGFIMSGRSIRDVNNVASAAKIKRSTTYMELSEFSTYVARWSESVEGWNKAPKKYGTCG